MSAPDPGNLFKSYTTNVSLTSGYQTVAGVDYASDSAGISGTNSGFYSPAYLWYVVHAALAKDFTDTPEGLDAMNAEPYVPWKDADGIIMNCIGYDFPFRYQGYMNFFIIGEGILSLDLPQNSCTLNYPEPKVGWPPPDEDAIFFEFANQYLGMAGNENYSSFGSSRIDYNVTTTGWDQSLVNYDNGLIGGFIPVSIDSSNLSEPAQPNGGVAFWGKPLQSSDSALKGYINTGVLKTARISWTAGDKNRLAGSGISYEDLKSWLFPIVPPIGNSLAFSMNYPPINPASTDILIPQHTIPPLKRRIPFQNYTMNIPRMIKK